MHCFVGNILRCKSAKNYKIRLKFHKAISIQHQANGNVQVFWATLYVARHFVHCLLVQSVHCLGF